MTKSKLPAQYIPEVTFLTMALRNGGAILRCDTLNAAIAARQRFYRARKGAENVEELALLTIQLWQDGVQIKSFLHFPAESKTRPAELRLLVIEPPTYIGTDLSGAPLATDNKRLAGFGIEEAEDINDFLDSAIALRRELGL